MSYEAQMLEALAMPAREAVERVLLTTLFKHHGSIIEFSAGERIVDEMADALGLTGAQTSAYLHTVYRKENREKRSSLWHRLLFRTADSLAKRKFVSRPSATLQLTAKKEWMLTEAGLDAALELLNLPAASKTVLPVTSFEVQKVARLLAETPRPDEYDPIDDDKALSKSTRESTIRSRGFRQAVVAAYGCSCAFCGLKLDSPDSSVWEVEAAHIVPHSALGKDDVWNGLALCRFHHWAFDVGWYAVHDDFSIRVSHKLYDLPVEFGRIGDFDLKTMLIDKTSKIRMPNNPQEYPHQSAMAWHRRNLFQE